MSTYCSLPWKHLATHPHGGATLCCVSDFTNSKNSARDYAPIEFKNLNTDNINGIINSDYFKEVRLQMLSGQQPEACKRCYSEEAAGVRSKRIEENERLGFTEEMAAFITSASGEIPVNFSFVELRLGNLCNVKCRTCNPASSTSWTSEYTQIQQEMKFVTHYDKSFNSSWTESDAFWDDLLAHCGDLQLLYINGGEPTLVEKHWKFLERLIARGLHNQVTLWYNINMTNLPDKLLNIWKQFKAVQVSCSIDDLGERNEYIRTGTKWSTVIENLDKLQSLPWINTSVCQTISWLNVAYLPEFHAFMKDRGLHVHMNFVHDPIFLSVKHLPESVKTNVMTSCASLEQWKRDTLANQFNALSNSDQLSHGMKYNERLDQIRRTSYKQIFPKMWALLEGPKLKEKHFCLMPWTHMHVWPNGNAYMCCIADSMKPLGKISDLVTIKQMWNSDKMKANRLSMLANQPVKECSRCYEIEAAGNTSQRMNQNRTFVHHLPKVHDTLPDGTVEKVNMPYMDIRFSNICNLRCRTCGPDLSSRWSADAKFIGASTTDIAIQSPTNDPEALWVQLRELLPTVEMIYFAGGEPMLTEEHYRILKMLIDAGRTDVQLRYNTNFTIMQFKDLEVFKYWKLFKDVSVGASLDASGQQAEYIRKETDWSTIEATRRKMMVECPDVDFYVNITISVFNVDSMPAFHREWIEKGLIQPYNWNVNLLTMPPWYRVHILPAEYRETVANKYRAHIEWLSTLCDPTNRLQHVISQFKSVINFMQGDQLVDQLPQFIDITNKLDSFRKESFAVTFPELAFLLEK